MKHTKKVEMAKKMRTPAEEKGGVPLFQTGEWVRRKQALALKNQHVQKAK